MRFLGQWAFRSGTKQLHEQVQNWLEAVGRVIDIPSFSLRFLVSTLEYLVQSRAGLWAAESL